MNHIYKVIFNKATGTFMAVAEYAKSHSTGGGSCATGQVGSVRTLSFARVATLAVLVIGATLSGSAYAQRSVDEHVKFGSSSDGNTRATGEASLAIGSLAEADGNQAIAIGGGKPQSRHQRNSNHAGPKAKGRESIAIGGDVTAEGDASIAIGSDDLYLEEIFNDLSKSSLQQLIQQHPILKTLRKQYRRTQATGHASTAVGAMSQASGHFANAFGTRATAGGHYSLAVGLTATATAQSAIAVGSNAQASNFAATAIGGSTAVATERGVALGYGSKILGVDNKNDAYIPPNGDLKVNPNKATQKHGHTDILSIGGTDIKRKIINVGAGLDDTDAVNVAQLKAAVDLANRKITFKGDDSSPDVQKGLGEELVV